VKVITHDEQGFEIEQGSDAWKQLRVGLLTGTGICDVLPGKRGGYLDKRQDQLDEIVTELFTGKPSGGFRTTKYMKEGIEREPIAKMLYTERTGRIINEVAFIRHDWMRVGMSPDGLVRGSRRRNVEVKCPKDRTHLRYLQMTKCPEEYVPQVQSQLWLGDFEECDFISYHPDFPEDMQLHVITVQRDEAYIQTVEAEVSKFLAEVNVKVKDIKQLVSSRKA
jgi:hypothetical protein